MIARRSSIRLPVVALLLPVLASGCGGESAPSRDLLEGLAPRDQVDALAAQISEGIQKLEPVVTIEHGRLAEQGSHAQLLRRDGLYAEMWARQQADSDA